jgi:hypothetical protein
VGRLPSVQFVIVSGDAPLGIMGPALALCSALGPRKGREGPEEVVPRFELDGEAVG